MNLTTPHIPLGVTLKEGLDILRHCSAEIEQREDGREAFYKVAATTFECGFYERDGIVVSSWYDDPIGRYSDEGIKLKISRYLVRYGPIDDWKPGINNGWIQFFINEKAGINMAHGLHNDVLRFNRAG